MPRRRKEPIVPWDAEAPVAAATVDRGPTAGTIRDFLDGFGETAPLGASVCEYFGIEGDPGAYCAYSERDVSIGRWVYFHDYPVVAIRALGRREGEWLSLMRDKHVKLPYARTQMLVDQA